MATGRPVDNPIANSGLDGQYSKFARDAFWKKLSMDPWVGNMFRRSRNNFETHMHNDEQVYSPAKPWKLLRMRRTRGHQPHKVLEEISVQQALIRSYVKGTTEYDARVAAGSKTEVALKLSATETSKFIEKTTHDLRKLYRDYPTMERHIKWLEQVGAMRQHFLFRWADAWSDIHYSGPSKWDKLKYPDGNIKKIFKKLNVFRYMHPSYWYERWHGYWHAGDDIRQIRYNFKMKKVPAHSRRLWLRVKYHYYEQPASSALVDPTLDHVPTKWRPLVAKLRGKGMRFYDEWFIRRPTSHLILQGAGVAAILYAANYAWKCIKTENTAVDVLTPSLQAWRKREDFTTEHFLTSERKEKLRKLWKTAKDIFEDW